MFCIDWMSCFITLRKLIISMDIIVWELTQLHGLQHSSYVCDTECMLWGMSLGKLSMGSGCICLLRYFQSLFKCQTLYHLNNLVMRFCCEWLLTLGRVVKQLLCMFAFDSGACLLSGVMNFKSCFVFSWLRFHISWL